MDDPKTTDLKARGAGVALVGLGAFLLKLGFFDVLRDAGAGASSVSTSGKAVLAAPFLILCGLFLVVIGAPGDGSSGLGRHFVRPSDRRLSPLGWVLVAAMVVPGLILYVWLQDQLEALGYG